MDKYGVLCQLAMATLDHVELPSHAQYLVEEAELDILPHQTHRSNPSRDHSALRSHNTCSQSGNRVLDKSSGMVEQVGVEQVVRDS